jgi:hypothetical protein
VKRVPIERRKNLSPADFVRDYLEGAGRPVLVTDATEGWPARSKWTFEFLKAAYGSDFVTAPLGLFSKVAKLTKLATYIAYLDTPAADLPGFWVDVRTRQALSTEPQRGSARHYLTGWDAFENHPELFDDINPAPYFVADWVTTLKPALRKVFEWTSRRDYWAVYIGPEGALSRLHQDFWHTHAYLALIQGRKHAILFSPEDSELLYKGRVDPEQPDLERFPLLERATAYECVIEPGELLFMPPGWWHQVRSLEKSIVLSHSFFNGVNVNEHLTSLLRDLPRLVRGFDRFPGWREELGVDWHSQGFSDPGTSAG